MEIVTWDGWWDGALNPELVQYDSSTILALLQAEMSERVNWNHNERPHGDVIRVLVTLELQSSRHDIYTRGSWEAKRYNRVAYSGHKGYTRMRARQDTKHGRMAYMDKDNATGDVWVACSDAMMFRMIEVWKRSIILRKNWEAKHGKNKLT